MGIIGIDKIGKRFELEVEVSSLVERYRKLRETSSRDKLLKKKMALPDESQKDISE